MEIMNIIGKQNGGISRLEFNDYTYKLVLLGEEIFNSIYKEPNMLLDMCKNGVGHWDYWDIAEIESGFTLISDMAKSIFYK